MPPEDAFRPYTRIEAFVNAATGVPRQFYKYFAAYLRDHGWTTVTYDYRGIGGSAPANLRGFDARMRDWALIDMPAVIDWLSAEFRPRRIFSVGHSFGGQGIGLLERPDRITAMVGVSAQSGYWGVQGGSERYRARFAVTVLIPALTRLFGYFPWSRFAAGEDLPGDAATGTLRCFRRTDTRVQHRRRRLGHGASSRCDDASLSPCNAPTPRARRLRAREARPHGILPPRLRGDLGRDNRLARRNF